MVWYIVSFAIVGILLTLVARDHKKADEAIQALHSANAEREAQRESRDSEAEARHFQLANEAAENQRIAQIAQIRQIVRSELAELFPEKVPEGNYLGYVLRGERTKFPPTFAHIFEPAKKDEISTTETK